MGLVYTVDRVVTEHHTAVCAHAGGAWTKGYIPPELEDPELLPPVPEPPVDVPTEGAELGDVLLPRPDVEVPLKGAIRPDPPPTRPAGDRTPEAGPEEPSALGVGVG